MTNDEAWFNTALRPRKPEGSLGRTAQDGHLDSHTAPELKICLFILTCPIKSMYIHMEGGMVLREFVTIHAFTIAAHHMCA